MANQQQPGDSAAGPAPLSPKGAARRRFTRAGAAASGVLLTLHSHPAMAQVACATASGNASATHQSHRPGEVFACAGLAPEYWRDHPEAWPTIGCDKTQPYCGVFKYSGRIHEGYSTVSQIGIMAPKKWDQEGLGRYMMAAYLNALTRKSANPTIPALQKIWVEWRDFGHYTATAGVEWNAAKIVAYLKTSMPL